jgi:hypothetical protein
MNASARFSCGGSRYSWTCWSRVTGPFQRSATERQPQLGTPEPVWTTVLASYSRSFCCLRIMVWRDEEDDDLPMPPISCCCCCGSARPQSSSLLGPFMA